MDRLPKRYRELIHEYGFVIVSNILDDSDTWPSPDDLEFQLMQWRHRRQEEWLK